MGRRAGSQTPPLEIRVAAVALVNSGVPVVRVSAVFHFDSSTVRSWVTRYRRTGMEGLRNVAPTGRRARVDDPTLRRLLREALAELSIGSRYRPTLRELTRRTSVSLGTRYDVDHLSRRLHRILVSKDWNMPVSEGFMSFRPKPGLMRGREVSTSQLRELDEAIRSKDLARVRVTAEQNPRVLATRNSNGLSPLMVAIYSSAEDVARYLASNQPPDIFDAAAMGDSNHVAWLLSQEPGLIKGFSPDGWTPLHLAAHFGQVEMASLLIAKGARVDAVAKNGIANQPLQAAIAGRHTELVRLLLAAGADVNHRSHGGFTAAHIAAENDDVDALELLRAAGADFEIKTAGGKTPRDVATEDAHESARRWFETARRTN